MTASPRKTKPKEDRHFVAALARGLSVLACFRSSDKVLSNQEIAKRCGLPKSTVSRLTHTLTRLGYLQFVESEAKYRLGTATLALGSAMLARMSARQVARPLMQDLADATGSVVAMGAQAQLSMVYVEVCRSRAPVTISLDVGARLPLTSSAMGRAYLAVLPAEEREPLLAQLRAADRAAWPETRAIIAKAIEEYDRLGCCVSFGDWQKDLNAIAVAFRPGGNTPTLAISCGGPAFQLAPKFLLDVARPRLTSMVSRLGLGLAIERD